MENYQKIHFKELNYYDFLDLYLNLNGENFKNFSRKKWELLTDFTKFKTTFCTEDKSFSESPGYKANGLKVLNNLFILFIGNTHGCCD